MVLLVGAGIAYANSTQDTSAEDQDERDGSYKGSTAASQQNGSFLLELAKID